MRFQPAQLGHPCAPAAGDAGTPASVSPERTTCELWRACADAVKDNFAADTCAEVARLGAEERTQAWFIAEHLGDAPVVRANDTDSLKQPRRTPDARAGGSSRAAR